MARYAVEVFASRIGEAGLEAQGDRARMAAALSASDGIAVRYLSSILLPAEELCLHVFEGPSAEVVRRTAVEAGLDPLRVIETVTESGFGAGTTP